MLVERPKNLKTEPYLDAVAVVNKTRKLVALGAEKTANQSAVGNDNGKNYNNSNNDNSKTARQPADVKDALVNGNHNINNNMGA